MDDSKSLPKDGHFVSTTALPMKTGGCGKCENCSCGSNEEKSESEVNNMRVGYDAK